MNDPGFTRLETADAGEEGRAALLRRIVAVEDEPAGERRRKFPLVTLLIAVAALQLVLIAYLVFFDGASPSGRSPDEQGPAAVPAAASADSRAPSGPRANATQLVAQGYVVAQRQATVSSRQLGVIKEIYVDEGDVVDKGQVLGQLDPRDAQIALRALQAELRVIEAETRSARAEQEQERSYLARYAALEERGFLSSHDRDLAQTRFEVARAKVASAVSREDYTREQIARARLQIDDLSIRAPFAGVVIERNAQPGEVLAPSGAGGGFTRTGLCTIVDMSSLQIVIDVNEQMITRVREGQRVEAELSAYRDLKVSGRVAQITPSADRARGTVRVRIQLLTEDPRILPDMAVKVRFL